MVLRNVCKFCHTKQRHVTESSILSIALLLLAINQLNAQNLLL